MMAKKITLNRDHIIEHYMDYVLENNEKPKSVYTLAKHYKFDESEFYNYFGSLDTIEKEIFVSLFTNTLKVLEKDAAYKKSNPRHKLLSFYYTFFENLTANRSYFVYTLNTEKNNLKTMSVLSKLKLKYTRYIDDLGIELIDIKQDQLNKIKDKGLTESAWFQLLLTMKFWLEDSSANFEKTDIYIEKSLNTSFDVLHALPLKSIVDFGKFIFKEKIKMNS